MNEIITKWGWLALVIALFVWGMMFLYLDKLFIANLLFGAMAFCSIMILVELLFESSERNHQKV